MDKQQFVNNNRLAYCPICGKYFESSQHLNNVFVNENSRWFANMVTHYRHTHITSWNKCWGHGGGYYRRGWFKDYDTEKSIVNERAKRQIIRKCKSYIFENGFKKEDLLALQGNSSETINLFEKIISSN